MFSFKSLLNYKKIQKRAIIIKGPLTLDKRFFFCYNKSIRRGENAPQKPEKRQNESAYNNINSFIILYTFLLLLGWVHAIISYKVKEGRKMHNVLRLMLAKKKTQNPPKAKRKRWRKNNKRLARFNKKCYNKIIEKEMIIKWKKQFTSYSV